MTGRPQPWRWSHRADPRALPLADRHYTRQKPGAPQFVPPGRCIVLLTDAADALWVTSWPLAAYVRHAWAGAMVCCLFRREPDCLHRASDLIVAACAATRARWPDLPDLGLVTFVDPTRTRHKRDPGRCFRRAGFTPVGHTAAGLVALQLRPEDFPAPAPARPRYAHGQGDLFDEMALPEPAALPAAAPPQSGNPSRPAVVERDASDRARADASPPAARDASRDRQTTGRVCAWCTGPIPAAARRDAICCSVRCRQARHRFGRTIGRARAVAPGRPLRLAYADPPYPGNARLYRGHPDYAGEVDHAELIERLAGYDGWALSTSAAALPAVLALCPAGARVAAWHRGERPTASWRPLNAWEPVIYVPGRLVDPSTGPTRRVDSLVHGVSAMTTLPGRVVGAKPPAFSRWIFDLLGAQPGDTLDDLYPGSGAVTRAWTTFTSATDPSPEVLTDASHPARANSSLKALHDASCPTSDATDPHTEASSSPADTTRATRAVPTRGGGVRKGRQPDDQRHNPGTKQRGRAGRPGQRSSEGASRGTDGTHPAA